MESGNAASHGTRHPGISPRFQLHHRGGAQTSDEIEIAMSAVTVAELVHGIARAKKQEIRDRRRAFIDELKRHVPVHPITDATAEIAGTIGGEQASKGNTIPIDDLLIGSSAVEQGYAVGTLNLRHFEKIPGLTVLKP